MEKLTDITVILDRSGSMGSIKSSTIKGFNFFLRDQQKDEFKSIISLMQFDDIYEVVYEAKNVNHVQNLNCDTFIPRGMTALLDAIGTTITSIKKRIKKLPKTERPANVVIAIITDGMENASRKYTREEIFKMIRKREEKDQWKFVFLAANQDAVYEGSKFGIKREQALTYAHDSKGVQEAMHSFSSKLNTMKRELNADFFFDEEDREKQRRNKKNDDKN